MSRVRNDLFNIEDIVEDDLVEIEIDNNLQIIFSQVPSLTLHTVS